MIDFNDLLAEYFTAEEHASHAEVLHVAHAFHLARAGAKRARKNGNDDEGDRLDGEAAKLARIVEQVMGLR
jgi:hypothetical protein